MNYTYFIRKIVTYIDRVCGPLAQSVYTYQYFNNVCVKLAFTDL